MFNSKIQVLEQLSGILQNYCVYICVCVCVCADCWHKMNIELAHKDAHNVILFNAWYNKINNNRTQQWGKKLEVHLSSEYNLLWSLELEEFY